MSHLMAAETFDSDATDGAKSEVSEYSWLGETARTAQKYINFEPTSMAKTANATMTTYLRRTRHPFLLVHLHRPWLMSAQAARRITISSPIHRGGFLPLLPSMNMWSYQLFIHCHRLQHFLRARRDSFQLPRP